ncbi:MAG: hypothetical protein Q9159_003886 [Coniocarpon cinnabarinum]
MATPNRRKQKIENPPLGHGAQGESKEVDPDDLQKRQEDLGKQLGAANADMDKHLGMLKSMERELKGLVGRKPAEEPSKEASSKEAPSKKAPSKEAPSKEATASAAQGSASSGTASGEHPEDEHKVYHMMVKKGMHLLYSPEQLWTSIKKRKREDPESYQGWLDKTDRVYPKPPKFENEKERSLNGPSESRSDVLRWPNFQDDGLYTPPIAA